MSEPVVWLLSWSLALGGYQGPIAVKQPDLVLPTREVCEQAAHALEALPSLGDDGSAVVVVAGCAPESRGEGS